MLKAFRDNLKSFHWVLWVVIAAFILLAFAGMGGLGPDDPDVAATVGGQTVSFAEVRREYQALEQQYRQMFGDQFTPEMAEQFRLESQALERLVSRKVLLAEAGRLGLRVSDEELRREVLDEGFRDPDGRFVGTERYAQILRSVGYTTETFEEMLRESILQRKLVQILTQNLYLSDAAVERAYRDRVERAAIRYVQVPAARFAAEAQATPEELRAYLASHPDELRLPAQRRIAYLLVDEVRLRSEITVPEAELRAAYEERRDEFTRPEQVRARHVLVRTGQKSVEEARAVLAEARRRIEGGEDFGAVARELSEDPGSAARGGDLGWFGRGQMVPPFEEAAFSAADGELVGPVESDFGVHLLEVTGRRPAGQAPFEEVRGQIEQAVGAERIDDLARQRAVELVSTLRAGEATPAAMRALAERHPSVVFQETQPFGLQDPVAGIGRSPELNEAAFALAAGGMSEPIEVARGWAVIHVLEALEPRVPELAEVEPRVRAAVEQEKRARLAREALEAAKPRLASGGTLEEIAAELGVEVAESEEFGAQGQIPGLGNAPQVTRAALSMDEGAVGGPFETPQGAVLFEVTSRSRFDPAQLAAERDTIREQLASERINQFLASLIEQRREEIGVSYSRQAVEQLGLQPAGQPTS